jgi:sterol-4alpha-carboxylate 3-dehydrogenase (decarboxylating)
MLTCAVRPAGMVGENDRGGLSHGFLSTAANAPNWQLHFQLGEGDNLFDATYVGNVAFALAITAEGLLTTYHRISSNEAAPLDHERIDGEAFNVTNDSPAYFWDMARYIFALYGRSVNIKKVWQMPDGLMLPFGALAELITYVTGKKTKLTRQSIRYAAMTRYYSCDKLKRRCGYVPLVGLEEGLARSVRSFVWQERETKGRGGEEKKAQ